MMKVGEVKMKRKVNVIEDLDGKKTVFIHDILFKGKRAMKWDEVEKYLRQLVTFVLLMIVMKLFT